MNTITLSNIKLYAYHGCLKEERIIGSDYLVNLTAKADLSKSCVTDQLNDTIDYVTLQQIVKEEMAIPSNLLEHVAQRIIERCGHTFDNLYSIKVEVAKLNPPIQGDVASVSISCKKEFKRKKSSISF